MSHQLSSRTVIVAIIVAVVLALPALWTDFVFDDYFMVALVEDWYEIETPTCNLYSSFMDLPQMGWWRSEEPQIGFWRPLSSALFRLNYEWFGRNAVPHHVHGLLWLAAMVGLCGALYRRLPKGVAVVALFVFAFEEAHGLTSGVICNHHAVIGLTCGLFGLWAHIRWREDGWRAGLPVSLGAYGLAFLAGEIAMAALAYVLAYEVFGSPDGWRARLASVAPASFMTVAYLIGYKLGGFGARESSLYLDPFGHPVEFLVGMTHHVPAMLAAMWTGFPAMLWNAGLARPLEITGVVATVLVLVALRWLWPSLDAEDRRGVTWLGCGALMSLAPAALPQPMDRQLLVPMVGGAVVLATILVRSWEQWRRDGSAGIGRWVAVAGVAGLALVHLLAAPALRVVQLQGFVAVNEASEGFADDLMRILDDREGRGLSRPAATILVTAESPIVGVFPPMIHDFHRTSQIMPWETLSVAPTNLRVERTGERTLELTALSSVFFASDLEVFMRPRHEALGPGDRVTRPLFEAEIVPVSDDGPDRIAFHFVHDLDDLLFLDWRDGTYRVVDVPDVGGSIEVASPEPFGPF